jgi:hypothetical protein
MTRKLLLVGLTLTVIVGLALSGIGRTERAVVKAEAAAPAAPFFGVCDPITNVKVRALPRSDFEITWEFNPPGSCLVPDGFDIEVRAKRNLGGGLLGKRNIRANAGERRVVVNFRSLAGFDTVEATVGTKIKFEPFAQGSSGKL